MAQISEASLDRLENVVRVDPDDVDPRRDRDSAVSQCVNGRPARGGARREGRMHRIVWLLVALVLMSGCARAMSDRDLQRVARDWAMVVRASQIIPVYPLTEDLQPGDIFLVQVTVDEQAKRYRERGFLALDNLIFRLDPRGYESFYRQSFEAGSVQHPLPKEWLTPGKAEAWVLAPNASFPTYAFSARRGGGFNVALPVQGIPVGLSLLGGDATQGTITIAEARTYGVDTMSLHDDVRRWAEVNRSFLQFYGGEGEGTNYVRVVSRVYLTGRVNVALQSSQSSGATASGGASKPVDLVAPTATADPQKNTLDAYTSNIEKLNAMIEKAMERAGGSTLAPGGTVKVVAASSGSITIAEDFARPLVIGYLGFDMAIGPGGVLGPPMPTHSVLERGVSPAVRGDVGVRLSSTAAMAADYQTLKTLAVKGDAGARGLVTDLDALGGVVPAAYPCNILGQRNPGGPLEAIWAKGRPLDVGTGFDRVMAYRGRLYTSIAAIRRAQADPRAAVAAFAARGPEADDFLRGELAANEAALRTLHDDLRGHRSLLTKARVYLEGVEE